MHLIPSYHANYCFTKSTLVEILFATMPAKHCQVWITNIYNISPCQVGIIYWLNDSK